MRKTNPVSYRKIQLPVKLSRPVLALGAHTKNSVCFAEASLACLSTVHPDLSNPQDLLNFTRSVKYFLKKKPTILACDLHPEYQSTKYALSTLHITHYTLHSIQHHHAHIASCMADNNLKNQKVIGAAFDGTGLGADGMLWGAEFLICDYRNFQRKAHLKQIPLIGAERAVREPWRVAAAWLYLVYRDRFLNLNTAFIKNLPRGKWRVLKNIYLAGFNSPLSSSMGRLFDASASLILGKYQAGFEAELAQALEKLAARHKSQSAPYAFDIRQDGQMRIIDPAPMFKGIVADLRTGKAKEEIAYRFHATVAEMVLKTCLILRKETRINKVVLSGGVFQNSLLLAMSLDLLYKTGFLAFSHRRVSCNDSGICLGQALIADFQP